MLEAVLDSDSQRLEHMILAHPDHVNLPLGTPFEVPGGRFFHHPAMRQCVILEHPNQTLLDIACALPAGPVIWVLIANGGKGSTHPLGTDLALHNAIKNARAPTVQSLLFTGQSNVNGLPGTTWKPLHQATFWNVPEIVRMLLDRGANVNDSAAMADGTPLKTALQLALDRRADHYFNQPIRERIEKILKMLLDSGANIHVPPAELDALTPFETFIKPWQGSPNWMAHVSPDDMYCLEAFLRKGADIQAIFTAFSCSSPSSTTFEHQVLWHSTPAIARLLIDHASPNSQGNGSNMLHEILGSCPDVKRHPAETLRDIEVLLQRGANPNRLDRNGSTPLKTCIDRCPAVDIIPRLKALLNGGADPEMKDNNGFLPFVHATRTFSEPLLSQVLHVLVAKFRGGHHQIWHEQYFPIPTEPTLAQVLLYSGQSGGFTATTHRLMPEDVRTHFQRAAFSVASTNFLDAITHRVKMAPDHRLSGQECDELRHMIELRQASFLPPYAFDQEVILNLLAPPTQSQIPTSQPHTTIPSILNASSPVSTTILLPDTMPGPPLAFPITLDPNLPTPIPLDTPQTHPPSLSRRSSASSINSNQSVMSFFIPTTTQVRWSDVETPAKPGDLQKATQRILKYRCKSCKDGNLLTKAEFKRHEEEHLHTLVCCEEGCPRRFCVAERG